MKIFCSLISISIFQILFVPGIYSQNPAYNLKVLNLQYYGCPSRILEFDIYIEHTNYPIEFRYNAGQYFFNFNPAIANGGTLIYDIVGSDLPVILQPWNPQVFGSQLRLASNNPGGLLNSYLIPNIGYPGTKAVRMRLSTTASSFANVPLNLEFRNSVHGNPFTKISAYTSQGGVDITTWNTHSVDPNFALTCNPFLMNTPEFNSPSNPSPVTFSWLPALQAVDYKLQISTDVNFGSYTFNDSGIVDSYHEVDSLSQNTNFYWRVFARNDSGCYSASQTWYFNTGAQGNAEAPSYILTARDFIINDPEANQLEFDIYIEHTNPPVAFEYSVGQYYFDFNSQIANGGELTFEIIGSDMPLQFQPVNPEVEGNILRLNGNPQPPGPGFGLNLTGNGFPGTKVVRMRLTNSTQFLTVPLKLVWRNNQQLNPCTKIFAYTGAQNTQVFTNVTTPATHVVSTNFVLPIELSSFTYIVERNNVTISWTTSAELNNCCFDIERAVIHSNSTPINLVYEKVGAVSGNGTTGNTTNYSFFDRVNTGKYAYRLKQIDYNHNFEYFNLNQEVVVGFPVKFEISQNYPNPFNPVTKFDFELSDDSNVKIIIYNAAGNEIVTLIDEHKTAGRYTIDFDASVFSSGIYFYKFIAGEESKVKTMMLIK